MAIETRDDTGVTILPISRLRSWYRDPEQEFFRREVNWTLRWMRGRSFIAWVLFSIIVIYIDGASVALTVIMQCGPIISMLPREMSAAVQLGLLPLNDMQPLGWLAILFLLSRRTMRRIRPPACRELILSEFNGRNVWPALLVAPMVAMLAFATIEGVVLILFINDGRNHSYYIDLVIGWSLLMLPVRIAARALLIVMAVMSVHSDAPRKSLALHLIGFIIVALLLNAIPVYMGGSIIDIQPELFRLPILDIIKAYHHQRSEIRTLLLIQPFIAFAFVVFTWLGIRSLRSPRMWERLKGRAAA